MRVIDYFYQGVLRGEGRAAFVEDDNVVSWTEAKETVEQLSEALHGAGVPLGARVGVCSPNSASAFLAILAAFRAGALWVPVNARNSVEANQHWLALVGCQVLFYHSSLEREALALRAAMPPPKMLICLDSEGPDGVPSLARFLGGPRIPVPEVPDGHDVYASMFPTGGTTGLSKAAEWTLRTWESLISSFWQCLPLDEPPVHLVAGPMTHAAGGLALCAMPGGATNVILKQPSPRLILESIERHKVTHLYLPPTLIYSLLADPEVRSFDYSSLRFLVTAAAPIAPAKLREAMDIFGDVICQSYGQAEAPMFLTFLSTRDLKSGPPERWASCGRATLNARVEIMNPDGHILPTGARGEIVTRSSLVMARYRDNPKATAAVSEYGWHHTGDVGYRDKDGFIYIVDRLKDMIITGGFNVFSAEIEQVVLEHPGILECAVIGVPDPKWGEAVKAIVEPKPGASVTADEVIALVKRKLGSVHAPKSVEIWSQLPRSPAGKVLKRDIRDNFWRGHERAV